MYMRCRFGQATEGYNQSWCIATFAFFYLEKVGEELIKSDFVKVTLFIFPSLKCVIG